MAKEKGKGRVKTVVEFGCIDGFTVCRVKTVNGERETPVKRLNAANSMTDVMMRVLEPRLTVLPFVKMFSFVIEPRKVSGTVGREEGTMRIEFRQHPSCVVSVAETAMEIYRTIINGCQKKDAAGKEEHV